MEGASSRASSSPMQHTLVPHINQMNWEATSLFLSILLSSRRYALLSRCACRMNHNDFTGNFSPTAMLPSPRGMVPIAANPNNVAFSCGCPTVTRDSRYKATYHRRTTDDGVNSQGFLCFLIFLLLLRICLLFTRRLVQEPPTIVESSSSVETARNTQATGSGIEMMHLLRQPDGAANNPGDLPMEEERLLEVPQ